MRFTCPHIDTTADHDPATPQGGGAVWVDKITCTECQVQAVVVFYEIEAADPARHWRER